MGDFFCQSFRQGGMTLFGQMHVVDLIELAAQLLGVQEVAADQGALHLNKKVPLPVCGCDRGFR